MRVFTYQEIRLSQIRSFFGLDLFSVVVILIPFFFIFPQFVFFNLLTIFLLVIWLFSQNIKERVSLFLKNNYAVLFSSTFLIYVLFMSFTNDINSGKFLLEKKLVILVFPMIFSTERISELLLKRILFSFVFSCYLAVTISILNLCINHADFLELISSGEFREYFGEVYRLDPPYFSLYITFSIIIATFYLHKEWAISKIAEKVFLYVFLICFVVIDLLLASRISLLALFILTIFYFVYRAKRNKLIGALLLLVTALTIGYLFSRSEFLNRRFKELTQTEWAPPVGIYYNSTNLRIGIWSCCYDLLKSNWLLGLGTGNVQSNLNECYKNKGFSKVMYEDEYTTHNEYFNVWLNTGLIGLFLFLISLFLPLSIAIQKRDFLFMAFLVLVSMNMLTESILERQKGIIFYAFFNSLLAFNYGGLGFRKTQIR